MRGQLTDETVDLRLAAQELHDEAVAGRIEHAPAGAHDITTHGIALAWLDAKLEQRLAESDARWERRLAELDTKWESRLAHSDARWEGRIAGLRTELATGLADVKSGLKWMYAFWAPTALAVVGTGAGVISLLLRR